MANSNTTSFWLDPPQIIGKPNPDGTISITPLDLKRLNDFNYYVAKMLQGGINLANLNADTQKVFSDLEGNVTSLSTTAEGLSTNVSNLQGELTNLAITVDGMRIADETGAYTIIDGDKFLSCDDTHGFIIQIQNGEIIIGQSAYGANLKFDGQKVYFDSCLAPMKLDTLSNMSIDSGDTIFIGTSAGRSGNVSIGQSGGTIYLNGNVYYNGNPLGAAVFT